MGGDNCALTHLCTGAQNTSLNTRQYLEGNLNTEIAAGHHNAIGGFDNFHHIGDSFLVFQLGDNFNRLGFVSEQLPKFANIVSLTDERQCNKVHIQ